MALLVATHLALCPLCRRALAELEAVGGALLEALPPEPVADDSLARLLARIDRPAPPPEPAAEAAPAARAGAAAAAARLRRKPRPGRLAPSRADCPRRGCCPASTSSRRACSGSRPGTALPHHTHVGSELTLVLQGGFSDVTGHFLRGDVCEADSGVDHRPVADQDEDCVCLVVTDAPFRLTGWLGRLLNPFIRI